RRVHVLHDHRRLLAPVLDDLGVALERLPHGRAEAFVPDGRPLRPRDPPRLPRPERAALPRELRHRDAGWRALRAAGHERAERPDQLPTGPTATGGTVKHVDSIQGYLCLGVAAALGLTVLTIVALSVVNWVS